MRVWMAAVLVAGVLAGCVGLDPGACSDEPGSGPTPWVEGWYLHTDPSQDWDTVVLQDQAETWPSMRSTDGHVSAERLSGEGDANFSVLHVRPGASGGHLELAYHLDD